MLDSIRERSQSFVVKAILVFLALTFALFGIGSYVTNQPEPAVAVVNGDEISRIQFDRAVDNERARQEQQFGDFYATLAADPAFNQRLRQQVLDNLINQTLLEQFARNSGMRMSNEQVKQAIRDYAAFQVAGQFDNDTYRMVLAQNGLSVEQFAENIRADLARSAAMGGLLDSEFVLASELTDVQQLINQTRSGAYQVFTVADYFDQVELTEAQIEEWYQTNLNQFAVPEQVKVNYVSIDAGAIAEQVSVDESVVREWYDNNQSRYSTADQYRFSHILIEGDDAEAEARADEVLAKLNNGEAFATLAETYSDDTFSAEMGGDLDFIEAGTMDPDFEEAAFALEEVGEYTDVVSTAFGLHIIQLTDIERGTTTSYEEVRDSILSDLRDQEVKQRYYELQQQVAEQAFEIPDTFAPIAEDTELTVRSSEWFSRNNPPTALGHPAVLAQVFDADFIGERLNSDLIEISDTESLVVRVTDYQMQTTTPLAEVREQVEQAVRQEQAQELARAAATELELQLVQGDAVELQMISAATRQSTSYPAAVIQQLFELDAPASDTSSMATTTLANGDIALVQLRQVTAGEVDAELNTQLQEQLVNNYTQQTYAGFVSALRSDAEIEVLLNQSTDN